MADEAPHAAVDEDGAPALRLAGATVVAPNTRSGNPSHEVETGRFGSGPGGRRRPKTPGRSKAVGPSPDLVASVMRRRDAVVDAARTLDDLSPDGVRELVKRRWAGTRALTEDDVSSFSDDARRQRIDDVVDALDYRIRRAVYARSRMARVDFPRGQIRSTIRGLSDDEVVGILRRLRERGWSSENVKRYVVRPFDDERKRMVQSKLD